MIAHEEPHFQAMCQSNGQKSVQNINLVTKSPHVRNTIFSPPANFTEKQLTYIPV